MIWQIDSVTQVAAQNFPLPIYSRSPLPQDSGDTFDPQTWQRHLRPGDVYPAGCSIATPEQIIAEFQASHYLQALALTISWGGMERTKDLYIYREHNLQHIYDTLDRCAQSIQKTNSIEESWDFLTEGLRWTNVITSKVLHFLCRALSLSQDPPVPIDNEVIVRYVWPGFRIGIPPGQRPQDWEGKSYTGTNEAKIAHYSFAAYCRYMTAVIEWAQARRWTSTQLESTIYAENK
jgi:hypothetical protein